MTCSRHSGGTNDDWAKAMLHTLHMLYVEGTLDALGVSKKVSCVLEHADVYCNQQRCC